VRKHNYDYVDLASKEGVTRGGDPSGQGGVERGDERRTGKEGARVGDLRYLGGATI